MAYNYNIREEEIKNRLRKEYFSDYDAEQILGDIDFAVAVPSDGPQLFETEYFLWAEAKKGTHHDIYESLVQLILTIGKARTFDKVLPPAFLGAFDAEKIAFIPYNAVLDIFYQNDFNWNVTPSDHSTKEFQLIMEKVRKNLESNMLLYSFDKDSKELKRFIKTNFVLGKAGVSKIRTNKNNFTAIYQKWLVEVKPSIAVNWEQAKKQGIIDADFYLADILSEHNVTLRNSLFVLLRTNYYELDRKIDDSGFWDSKKAEFKDNQVAHTQFWNRYERPPKREYWEYIAGRRDLLVPQDVRERKGSFFTPKKWVELSQEYLAAELGENWQDEYFIWDCCAGTGNLEAGLTNKYQIWVSTLDQADVDVIHDRIRHMNEASTNGQGANLLDKHVFQFDFLNDPFDLDSTDSKLPSSLREVLKDDDKRKKLVIYINPPYAEAASKKTVSNSGTNKTNVAVGTATYKIQLQKIGIAARELFAQFFMRVYDEIPSSILAEFSKLKLLQSPNFKQFRMCFKAKLGRNFIVPADTFDNVSGQFPIGFFIWHTDDKKTFEQTLTDVYNNQGRLIGKKVIHSYANLKTINDWIITTRNRPNEIKVGFMSAKGNDFQNTNFVFIINDKNQLPHPRGSWVTDKNIIEIGIYYAVRHVIDNTWLNDRDQFLYPNDGWKNNMKFQANCLIYTLFNNNIQSNFGTNNWIPFTEEEVGAQEAFESHFMSDFLHGKAAASNAALSKITSMPYEQDMFAAEPMIAAKIQPSATAEEPFIPLEHLTPEAKAVMDAGRELWRYYHQQEEANPNASLYDIRLHFQGYKTTKSGKMQMNTESSDAQCTKLITELRKALKVLAKSIEPKVYEYGFLLK